MTTAVVQYETPTGLPTVKSILTNAECCVVDDQTTYDLAIAGAKAAKEVGKTWQDEKRRRVALVKPLLDQINADFDPVINACQQAIDIYKGKYGAWAAEQEQIRIAAQRAAEQAAAEEKAKLERAAKAAEKKGDTEKAEAARAVAAVVTAPTVAPTFTKTGGAHGRKSWKGKVASENDGVEFVAWLATHPEFIPLCIDWKSGGLNKVADVYRDRTKVPGLTITEETTQVLR